MPKKLLMTVIAALAGATIARRMTARRAEQDLWTEATDPIDLR